MGKAILTVVAGCNGAGKSSFSNALTPNNTPSFDYDKEYLLIYKNEFDSDVREIVAHHKAKELLRKKVKTCILSKSDFTYETNFNSTPMYWPEKFKQANFKLRLFYFCLNSIKEAKRRVQIRVENGGHFVPEHEIESRYRSGFENLNTQWKYFDEVFLFEASTFKKEPSLILTVIDGKISLEDKIPNYLDRLIPNILKPNS